MAFVDYTFSIDQLKLFKKMSLELCENVTTISSNVNFLFQISSQSQRNTTCLLMRHKLTQCNVKIMQQMLDILY